MRTPKAVKLKSGNWRVQIQIDGKRYSCTGATKKEAQEMAKQIFAGVEQEKRVPLTVGKAIDQFIEAKSSILSPATIRTYKTIRKNQLKSIIDTNLSDLTQTDIQIAMNMLTANGKSPKTVKNACGLVSVVLKAYRPNFVFRVDLPQKEKKEIVIPTEEEMQKIWDAAKGSKYELPILFASWLGLRRSEIKGLKFEDVIDGRIHVHRAIVVGNKGPVEKGTKTVFSDRWIILPEEISKIIENTNGNPKDYICPMCVNSIYRNFVSICKKAGVGPFRFHDLRHFAASEAHALGIPDKYSMKRMGHSTDNMLKTVYQHTMQKKEDEFGAVIDQKMADLYKTAHETAHKNEKKP